MSDNQTTERVVFAEEGSGGRIRLIAAGEIDSSLLDAIDAFVSRRRLRTESVDGDWAE